MKENKKNIEAELSEIAPFLAQLKKDNIPLDKFEVPTDYFDKLSSEIFEKTILQEEITHQQPSIEPSKESIWVTIGRFFEGLLNPTIAVVLTSFVILVVAGIYLVNQESTDYGNNLTAVDIEEYVEANIETFEIETLANFVALDESASIIQPVPSTKPSIDIDDINMEDLEEYFEENYMDDIEMNELM